MRDENGVVVLTNQDCGFASYCVPLLVGAGVIVRAVIHATGREKPTRPLRNFRKVRKIGLAGALNGVRMRRWYREDVEDELYIEPLKRICRERGIEYHTVPSLNSAYAWRIMDVSPAWLALSLGTGLLRLETYARPALGTLNVHHELLPEFRGAQSVIWQLHDGSSNTGFTIHRVEQRLDGGDIVWRESLPIDFQPTLSRTVTVTVAKLYKQSAIALAQVVSDPESYIQRAQPQGQGRTFTTPTLKQFLQIQRQFARLRDAHLNPSRRVLGA